MEAAIKSVLTRNPTIEVAAPHAIMAAAIKYFFTLNPRNEFKLDTLALPAIAAMFAHVLYIKAFATVGWGRFEYKIPPPAMAGNPHFALLVRAAANQHEQQPGLLIGMLLFALLVNGPSAGVLGLLWVVMRWRYCALYSSKGWSMELIRYTIPCYLIGLVLYLGAFMRAVALMLT